MATAFLALVGFIAVGMALVVFGAIAKNRWGINLAEVSCPRCNKQAAPESEKTRITQAGLVGRLHLSELWS